MLPANTRRPKTPNRSNDDQKIRTGMAKPDVFKAWDAERKHIHEIPQPLVKTRHHRVDKSEWVEPMDRTRRKNQRRRATKRTKAPVTAATILRYIEDEIVCMHCGRTGSDPECGINCYRDFRSTVLTGERLTEIRHVGDIGYGAFTKPCAEFKRGQYLDEYLGDLRPLYGEKTGSLYNFWVPGKCIIDAEKSGNWTRFINSSCQPNLTAEPNFVEKRHCVVLRALRDIGPGEQLFFDYGKAYFRVAGFACKCGFCKKGIRKPKKGSSRLEKNGASKPDGGMSKRKSKPDNWLRSSIEHAFSEPSAGTF